MKRLVHTVIEIFDSVDLQNNILASIAYEAKRTIFLFESRHEEGMEGVYAFLREKVPELIIEKVPINARNAKETVWEVLEPLCEAGEDMVVEINGGNPVISNFAREYCRKYGIPCIVSDVGSGMVINVENAEEWEGSISFPKLDFADILLLQGRVYNRNMHMLADEKYYDRNLSMYEYVFAHQSDVKFFYDFVHHKSEGELSEPGLHIVLNRVQDVSERIIRIFKMLESQGFIRNFDFDNNGFSFELLDCAGGSSQGGKLSFWNCLVSKDNYKFKIGINSELLLDLLKCSSFVHGLCSDKLIFITKQGKVGMTVEGSETYRQCVKDRELLNTLKKTQTSKFCFGDLISTATINEVYLGTITKYYEFDPGERNTSYRYMNHFDIRECTITKLKKPVIYHLFKSAYKTKALSEILEQYDGSMYSYPDIKKTCPKRTITGKIEMDCTEEEFKQGIMNKTYDFKTFSEKLQESSSYKGCDKYRTFYYFLGKQTFGYGFEPFELSPEIMEKIKDFGIKYIEES